MQSSLSDDELRKALATEHPGSGFAAEAVLSDLNSDYSTYVNSADNSVWGNNSQTGIGGISGQPWISTPGMPTVGSPVLPSVGMPAIDPSRYIFHDPSRSTTIAGVTFNPPAQGGETVEMGKDDSGAAWAKISYFLKTFGMNLYVTVKKPDPGLDLDINEVSSYHNYSKDVERLDVSRLLFSLIFDRERAFEDIIRAHFAEPDIQNLVIDSDDNGFLIRGTMTVPPVIGGRDGEFNFRIMVEGPSLP